MPTTFKTKAEYDRYNASMDTQRSRAPVTPRADAATSQHPTLALINAVVAPELARVVRTNKQQDERITAIEQRLASIEQRVAELEARAASPPGPPVAAHLRRIV